jgi:hypothetical protein
VDLDGKTTFSEIRLLAFGSQPGAFKVIPNPAKATIHVELPQAAGGQDMVQLYEVGGRKVLQQTVPAGALQLDIDVSTLTPGIYILRYGNQHVEVMKQ